MYDSLPAQLWPFLHFIGKLNSIYIIDAKIDATAGWLETNFVCLSVETRFRPVKDMFTHSGSRCRKLLKNSIF